MVNQQATHSYFRASRSSGGRPGEEVEVGDGEAMRPGRDCDSLRGGGRGPLPRRQDDTQRPLLQGSQEPHTLGPQDTEV